MKRKVLTITNELGEQEDLIPYVDDLSIQIDGTNLKDYLDQIEETLLRASLFLGAFESEEQLVSKYPNGSDLKAGTYAIVTDRDAVYVYDTDTQRWLQTLSHASGILQLNGLTPVNGALTITGGDIHAIVPNADVDDQTITNHLDALYSHLQDAKYTVYGTIAYDTGTVATSVETNKVTFNAKVNDVFKNSKFLYMELRKPSSIREDEYTKNLEVLITYNDKTTKTLSLYSADTQRLKYIDLVELYQLQYGSSYAPKVLLCVEGSIAYIPYYSKKSNLTTVRKEFNISSSNWIDNEEGTGYKYVITPSIGNTFSTMIGVYKLNGSVQTTAIVDFELTTNSLTIYSDSKFDGIASVFCKF